MARPLRIITACAVVVLAGRASFAEPPALQAQALEYDVKAAYIFNLLPFTTWPPTAFASATSPLAVCVAEPNPFGEALKQAFLNEQVGSHPVVVKSVTSPDAVRDCHVLFIGAAADASGALEQVAETLPVLTIGETLLVEHRGGMITFVVEYGRVRFDVSQTAAGRANIQFSSKILQVARKIS